jgi:hypothetical protein
LFTSFIKRHLNSNKNERKRSHHNDRDCLFQHEAFSSCTHRSIIVQENNKNRQTISKHSSNSHLAILPQSFEADGLKAFSSFFIYLNYWIIQAQVSPFHESLMIIHSIRYLFGCFSIAHSLSPPQILF